MVKVVKRPKFRIAKLYFQVNRSFPVRNYKQFLKEVKELVNPSLKPGLVHLAQVVKLLHARGLDTQDVMNMARVYNDLHQYYFKSPRYLNIQELRNGGFRKLSQTTIACVRLTLLCKAMKVKSQTNFLRWIFEDRIRFMRIKGKIINRQSSRYKMHVNSAVPKPIRGQFPLNYVKSENAKVQLCRQWFDRWYTNSGAESKEAANFTLLDSAITARNDKSGRLVFMLQSEAKKLKKVQSKTDRPQKYIRHFRVAYFPAICMLLGADFASKALLYSRGEKRFKGGDGKLVLDDQLRNILQVFLSKKESAKLSFWDLVQRTAKAEGVEFKTKKFKDAIREIKKIEHSRPAEAA